MQAVSASEGGADPACAFLPGFFRFTTGLSLYYRVEIYDAAG